MVRPKGFEPLTYSSGGYRSIQLSYGRSIHNRCAVRRREWEFWGGRRDLNPQHPGPQPGALPLSYAHHSYSANCQSSVRSLACLEGFEPPTRGLEGRRSIQLSYRQWGGWYRGAQIRTEDPLLPKQMRYQTAPRPDRYTATKCTCAAVEVSTIRVLVSPRIERNPRSGGDLDGKECT